ncbi:MAG: putative aminohydrolase SsnA, partial [Chloroflexi bacterium]|nr:putative aminohydrolase SsnA [Chloroflexota bacterium]
AALEISSDGTISRIFEKDEIDNPPPVTTEVFDARHQYVIPGQICAHTHFYGAFSRGMYIPGEAPDAFPAILEKLWWKLDKSLDEDANYYSALVCLIDAIQHGTTTLVDHHASPNFISGSLDVLAKAIRESGLRASLCYEVTDRDGEEKALEGLEENARFIGEVSKENDGFLSALFGLHASLTLSDKTLRKAREMCPPDVGFHVHAAEHVIDEYDSMGKYGKRVAERLNDFDILGPLTVVGHGVHVDAHEISLLAETGTWVSHQPRSNMNNAVGLPEIESMLNAGVKVCLGNDGFSNAMWEEWKAAYLGHKLLHRDPRRVQADTIYQMAVINNRKLIQKTFGGLNTGQITPGSKADLIFVDYRPFTDFNTDNLPWHIIFGFRDSMITSTMVNGKFLMKDRELLSLDQNAIVAEAKKISTSVWKKYHQLF